MKYKKNICILGISILLLSDVSRVSAQTIPTSAQPAIIEREFKDKPTLSIQEGEIFSEEKKEGSSNLSKEKVFKLNSVILDGSTVYPKEEVALIVEDYLNKEVSFSDLNEISKKITAQYRSDGFMFSKVVLPPQKIKDGVVHFKALEGRITGVRVEGNFDDKNGLVKKYLEKLKSKVPTDAENLERYVLLIDDLPGIKARSLIQQSGTVDGGVDLVVLIDQDKFEGSASIDNRGTKYLGRGRGILVAAFNSLLGIHDRTTIRGISSQDSEELLFGDITHEEQIGSEGTKIKTRYAYTDTTPGRELRFLDVKGKSSVIDIEGVHPLFRGRKQNINLIAGFNSLDSESDLLGTNITEDRLRTLRAGFRYDLQDSLAGVSQVEVLATKGIDVFNSTNDGVGRTRINGEHDFLKTSFSATRIQSLVDKFSLQVTMAGQYTNNNLLISEEFAVGGAEFGRAYDAGEITGDRGLAGSIELQYGGTISGEKIRKMAESYQLYTFYDAGKVWNEDLVVGELAHEAIASTGIGVRFNHSKTVSSSVELAKPLTRDVNAEGDNDVRAFFSLTKRF